MSIGNHNEHDTTYATNPDKRWDKDEYLLKNFIKQKNTGY